MPRLEERLQVDPWGSVGFQRQGSLWRQGSPQRGHVSSGPLLRLSSQRRRCRGGGGPCGGLRRHRDQVGARQPALVLPDVPSLLHLATVRDGNVRLGCRRRRSPLRNGAPGSDGGHRQIRPREAPRSRRSHGRGWGGGRQPVVGQVVVRQQREHRRPERWPWRLWGAAVSAAAVQGDDGVVVEPGPESLDVDALPLRRQAGVKKAQSAVALSFSSRKLAEEQGIALPPSPHPEANKPAPSLPPPPCAICAKKRHM